MARSNVIHRRPHFQTSVTSPTTDYSEQTNNCIAHAPEEMGFSHFTPTNTE
jgi:hypothetical protein